MSYNIYTTEALVCGNFEQNTADKSFLLFTREAGMLFANAKSVRVEISKQRFALQDFSRVRVSLIKGKQGWRVGSVEITKNDFSLANDRATRGSIVSIYKLLRRFIRGEEASTELYDFLTAALDEVTKNQPDRNILDLLIKIKILAILGYVDEFALPKVLREAQLTDMAIIKDAKLHKEMEAIITTATEISHL